MTEPLAHPELPIDPSHAEVVDSAPGTNIGAQLRTRVVREARRETWFVVNDGDDALATIPLAVRQDASLRRVEVNGEAAEFSADEEQVLVRPRIPLRAGAGTIIIFHFR